MANEVKEITEEMHLEKEWFEEASKQTFETLPEFVDRIMNGYHHDYGTVCHAISACAIAAAYAANHSPGARGGITGFQSCFIMWDFVRQWSFPTNKCGMKIVNYDNMLYPQYADKFEEYQISKGVWESLQKTAKEKMDESDKAKADYEAGLTEYDESACSEVYRHWKSIVDGKVPFGYVVKED